MALPERTSRKTLERRAYNLSLATGAAALATVVVLVLALVNVTSFGLAFLLAVVTAALAYGFKRTVSRR